VAGVTGLLDWHDESSRGNLLVLFKDGSTLEIEAIVGGGMFVGDDPDSGSGYEVHATAADGSPLTLQQSAIAAVLELERLRQVEFGNPFVASPAGHPRGRAVPA
jgi:hypothetical protein